MSDALLIGATGLIGGLVIAQAQERRLTILARRDIDGLPDRQHLLVAPPERWPAILAAEAPTVLLCALGTTIRQAGSQAAFRAVDHDLVLRAAHGARLGGTRHMVIVSSVGASARSNNFYLRTKGESEEGLRAMGFDRLDILRPGLLTGERAGPARMGEGIASAAAPLVNALLHGAMRRYRSIPAETVARAMLALVDQDRPGVQIHENDAIRTLAD